MGLLTWLKDRVRGGLIPYGGTFSTQTDEDRFPIAIANELMGGQHGYRTLEELAQIPVLRLMKPMSAIVLEHIRPDGSVFPRTVFIFDPSDDSWNGLQADYERIYDIPSYDLSVYWKAVDGLTDTTADLEYQYAAEQDYGAVSGPGAPAFQEPTISAANYQAGYKSNADLTIIWTSIPNMLVHKYVRQRVGSTSNWGIPIKILGESYSSGDYVDNRFRWVAKGVIPSTPSSLVNGVPNNIPTDWQGTPAVPGGIDYYVFLATNDLFRISGVKDAYQNLKSEWSAPTKISTDPLLVRYGFKPSSTLFLSGSNGDTADWRGYYTPNQDTHMAIRLTTSSPWRIQNIDQEEGEYTDYIWKEFLIGYEPIEADRPSVSNPFSTDAADYPNNNWKDGPFAPAVNKVLHYATARKFNNGDLKPSGWSLPVPANGEDIIQVVITPETSTTFKYDPNGAVTPSLVKLVAKFYRGNTEITTGFTISWYKGIYDAGNLIIDGSVIPPSQYHDISGTNGNTLDILPDAVNNTQLYTVRVVFEGEDYFDTQTVVDTADAQGYLAVIESNDGFVYKNTVGSKTFTAKLYNNGILVDNGILTFQWLRGVADITPVNPNPTNLVAVTAADFVSKEVLKINITVDGVVHSRTETLVDIGDAKATIFQYTTQTTTPDGSTVWTLDPTGAYYARVSIDGGVTFGAAFRVRGENAPYNGGFYRNVYKNSATIPTATGITSDLFPSPSAGWTDGPTTPGAGEYTWQATAFFTKIATTSDVTLNSTNWAISGSWSAVIRITGIDGNQTGPPGEVGPVGWSPTLALITLGSNEYLQVVDWTNLGGADPLTKPATGYYITDSGFSTDINLAKNVRGPKGDKGDDGVFNSSDFWNGAMYRIFGSNGSPNYESWDYRFRVSKNGIVYFAGRSYRNGSGNRFVDFLLGSTWTTNMIPASTSFTAGTSEMVFAVLSAAHYSNLGRGNEDQWQAHIIKIGSSYYLRVPFADNFTVVSNGSYPTLAALN